MPSLSPGTPGAKEAYGISVVRDDLSVKIPPKAFKRYELTDNGIVLLCTTRAGESGFGILNKEKAYKSVFKSIIDKIGTLNSILNVKDRSYALTTVMNGKIFLTEQMMHALHLKKGDRLIVIKSTTVTMSYSPVEIWKRKFEQRGFYEAIENMKKLEEF